MTQPVRSKYYFDKLTYDINYLASKFLKNAICSIFTSLSCFILVTQVNFSSHEVIQDREGIQYD